MYLDAKEHSLERHGTAAGSEDNPDRFSSKKDGSKNGLSRTRSRVAQTLDSVNRQISFSMDEECFSKLPA
jgi:uncharacterized FlaG/YvyC family protein